MKYILYLILCILQPICLPVPEATTILFGTHQLGSISAFLIGIFGILIGIYLMYKITNILSKKYLKKLKGSSKFKKYQRYMSKYPILTTGILFIIPVIPDEIICIGSALGNIKLSILFSIAFISKIISISMITFSENIAKILELKQWDIILIEILILIIASIIYQKINNNEKK